MKTYDYTPSEVGDDLFLRHLFVSQFKVYAKRMNHIATALRILRMMINKYVYWISSALIRYLAEICIGYVHIKGL